MNVNQFDGEAKILKALAHPARLAILELLRKSDQCVCHMEAALGFRQAYISQHLMVLRDAGIVSVRREGWNIYYHVSYTEIFDLLDIVYKLTGKHIQPDLSLDILDDCTCPRCQVVKHPSR